MTLSDTLMILAVLVGPIIAIQVTRFLDNKKEIRERKLQIFKALMSTRSYALHWDHVMALNRIDLEFDIKIKNEKAVIDVWKQYLDLLNSKTLSPEQWNDKRVDLLVELLHKMAIVLNYDFDKTHIKNASYAPVAHGDIESQQTALRKGLVEVLDGHRTIPVSIAGLPIGEYRNDLQ